MAKNNPKYSKSDFVSFVSAHPRNILVIKKLLSDDLLTISNWKKKLDQLDIEYTLTV